MFQPQPTPFSTFYPSYLTGSLSDGQAFAQRQPHQQQQQQHPGNNGLQVDNHSYLQAQAEAAAQQLALEAGGFSNYQQPTFAQAPVSSLLGPVGLEYGHPSQSQSHSHHSLSLSSSQPINNPCPGAGHGSSGGGGHGGAMAGVRAAAGAGPRPVVSNVGPPVPLSLAPQLQQQQMGMGQDRGGLHHSQPFPLHGAIPQGAQHQPSLSAGTGPSLFDHNPSPLAATAANNNFHPSHPQSRTPRQHQRQNLRQPPFGYRSYSHHSIPVSSGAGTNMDAVKSLQDDMALQEAAARTWQPDLEVRQSFLDYCLPSVPSCPGNRSSRLILAMSRQLANLGYVVQGPRVGDKTPIDAITAEYEKADPVYVAKTMVSFRLDWLSLLLGSGCNSCPVDSTARYKC